MNDLEISKKYAKIIVSKRFGNNFNINNKDLINSKVVSMNYFYISLLMNGYINTVI